jgi:hypothetical protein
MPPATRILISAAVILLALAIFLVLDAALGWGIWTDRWIDV